MASNMAAADKTAAAKTANRLNREPNVSDMMASAKATGAPTAGR